MKTYVKRRYLSPNAADFSEEEQPKRKKKRRKAIIAGVTAGVAGAAAVGAGAYAMKRKGKKVAVGPKSNQKSSTPNQRTPNARMAGKGKVRNASEPNSQTRKRSQNSEDYRNPAGNQTKRKRK